MAEMVPVEFWSYLNSSIKAINEDAILESLLAFKRAGASAIVTYFALEIAHQIKKSN